MNSGRGDEDLTTLGSRFSISKPAGSRSQIRWLFALLPAVGIVFQIVPVQASVIDECFAREGKTPIIYKKHRSDYERKLFLTPDEIARYLFLTNRRDDGDRSAAVYRAHPKKESLPGNYWVTATVAADSLIDHPNASVRRFDAPLPSSVANVLHELWLEVCQRSRVDEEALPSAPTGVFSVVGPDGKRLTVVTVSLLDEHSLCISLLNLSGLLEDYAKLPASERAKAATKIEKEARRLLKRVKQRS